MTLLRGALNDVRTAQAFALTLNHPEQSTMTTPDDDPTKKARDQVSAAHAFFARAAASESATGVFTGDLRMGDGPAPSLLGMVEHRRAVELAVLRNLGTNILLTYEDGERLRGFIDGVLGVTSKPQPPSQAVARTTGSPL